MKASGRRTHPEPSTKSESIPEVFWRSAKIEEDLKVLSDSSNAPSERWDNVTVLSADVMRLWPDIAAQRPEGRFWTLKQTLRWIATRDCRIDILTGKAASELDEDERSQLPSADAASAALAEALRTGKILPVWECERRMFKPEGGGDFQENGGEGVRKPKAEYWYNQFEKFSDDWTEALGKLEKGGEELTCDLNHPIPEGFIRFDSIFVISEHTRHDLELLWFRCSEIFALWPEQQSLDSVRDEAPAVENAPTGIVSATDAQGDTAAGLATPSCPVVSYPKALLHATDAPLFENWQFWQTIEPFWNWQTVLNWIAFHQPIDQKEITLMLAVECTNPDIGSGAILNAINEAERKLIESLGRGEIVADAEEVIPLDPVGQSTTTARRANIPKGFWRSGARIDRTNSAATPMRRTLWHLWQYSKILFDARDVRTLWPERPATPAIQAVEEITDSPTLSEAQAPEPSQNLKPFPLAREKELQDFIIQWTEDRRSQGLKVGENEMRSAAEAHFGYKITIKLLRKAKPKVSRGRPRKHQHKNSTKNSTKS